MTKSIKVLSSQAENQIFDRKSFLIDPKSLATTIVAFANADGGDIVLGIEDDGRIVGVDNNPKHLNELLRAPLDYCVPSINVEVEYVACKDYSGNKNRLLVMHVPQSPDLHANQADECFYRVGDKSKKLNFEQRMQLYYAKGKRYYEDSAVPEATIADIDLNLVSKYCKKIHYTKKPEEFLRTNKDFLRIVRGEEKISVAAILLFGKNTQQFFPRARIRVVRFYGDEERFGREMNVVKDVEFGGNLLDMTKKTLDFIATQIKEYSFLGEGAKFVTIPQYPEFCWTELVVNAVVHRDYSILGTDIIVKIFDNHLVVESPGILPGMVRLNNIRRIHFSRNPKIAQYMHEYDLVKEFGEGVDRLFREMESAGNPAPEYKLYDFMLKVKLSSAYREIFSEEINNGIKDGGQRGSQTRGQRGSQTDYQSDGQIGEIAGLSVNQGGSQTGDQKGSQTTDNDTDRMILDAIIADPAVTRLKLSELTGVSPAAVQKHINKLKKLKIIARRGGDFGGHWKILRKDR